MTKLQANRRGFSLIETLVAITISMLVAGSIVSLMVGQMKASSALNRNMLNEQTLRDSLAYMTDEINSMGNNTDEPFVSIASASSFQFNGDVNNDGDVDQIEYSFANNELSRTLRNSADGGATWDDVSTDVLIPDVQEMELVFYAPGNIETDVVDEITSVEIRVKLDEDAGATAFNAGAIAVEEQVARVTIRNRTLD